MAIEKKESIYSPNQTGYHNTHKATTNLSTEMRIDSKSYPQR